jgi:dihydrofolate reductase
VSARISIIAAVARNGGIGAGGGLPWRLSSDLRRFKALTMGKPLVLGRKTFESIGRPLPGRNVIVITRDRHWSKAGVVVAHDLDEALAAAAGAEEIMIGGGGEIYRLAWSRATRLYITEVDLTPEAEVRFPPIEPSLWRETHREPGERGPKDEADFEFVEYERV